MMMTTKTHLLIIAVLFIGMGSSCLLLNLIRPYDALSVMVGLAAIGIGLWYMSSCREK